MYKIIKSYNRNYGGEVYNVINLITKEIEASYNTYDEAAAYIMGK